MRNRKFFFLLTVLFFTMSRQAMAGFSYTPCFGKMGPWSVSTCAPGGFDPSTHYQVDEPTETFAPNPADHPPNALLVFLPGTGSGTEPFTHFVARAQKVGYHIIVLYYWDQHHLHLSAGCDPVAWGKIHNQICHGVIPPNITANNQYGNPGGNPPPAPQAYCNAIHDEMCANSNSSGERTALAEKDASGNYTVLMDPKESIQHRLTQILKWLSTNQNANNWSQFLVGGSTPDWTKIVIAGQSQGAGHAAFLAKWHPMKRVLLFSGIIDSLDYPQASDWPSCTKAPNSGAIAPQWVTDNQFANGNPANTAWATSLDKFWGLSSQKDADFWLDSQRIKANWDALKLYTLGASGTYPVIDGFQTTNLSLNGEQALTISDAYTCNACGSCPNPPTAANPDMVPHFVTARDNPCNDGGTFSTTDPNRPPIVKAWDLFLANP
jgi:hypothetical protein